MSDYGQIKYKAETMIMIGLAASETITESLRVLFQGLATSKDIRTLEKQMQGKRYKKESTMILESKRENVGLHDIAVSNSELKEFRKLCKEYGVDYYFQKRPKNLDELLNRQQAGESLSNHQEQVVKAFTLKDENGKPYLNDDAVLITFKESDLPRLERVLDTMEKRMYGIEKRKMIAQKILKSREEKKQSKKKKQEIAK